MNNERGKRRIIYYCVLALCIVMLSSCTKRSTKKERKQIVASIQDIDNQKSIILDKVIQQELMLVNVPIPLYDERILPFSLDWFESETITLGYISPLSAEQSIDFFIGQMERYGWKHIVSFESNSNFLFFENPDSYLCVVIKALERYGSSIFIYIKRASYKSPLLGSELG